MLAFIAKRLLWMLPLLVAISFLSFVLIQLPPGDYVTTYIATLAASNEVVDQNTASRPAQPLRPRPADGGAVLEVDFATSFCVATSASASSGSSR